MNGSEPAQRWVLIGDGICETSDPAVAAWVNRQGEVLTACVAAIPKAEYDARHARLSEMKAVLDEVWPPPAAHRPRCTRPAAGGARMTVWKYEIGYQAGLGNVLNMPADSRVLSIAMQGAHLCLWALVDPERPRVARKFEVIGTGQRLPDQPLHYWGTVLDGPYVWHVFET
jgi:hypothetical protein